MKRIILILAVATLNHCLMADDAPSLRDAPQHVDVQQSIVKEGLHDLKVTAEAPLPEEVENESQAQALSKEAATVRGQTALLKYVLQKKTRSKKLLSEAEIPSLELQDHIRGYIKGAKILRTEWLPKFCRVTLSLDKKYLNEILNKN